MHTLYISDFLCHFFQVQASDDHQIRHHPSHCPFYNNYRAWHPTYARSDLLLLRPTSRSHVRYYESHRLLHLNKTYSTVSVFPQLYPH